MNDIKPMAITGRIVQGLSNGEYHADKSTYSSSLVKMMDVPARAKAYIDGKLTMPGDHLSLGSAIHKWILEPSKFRDEFLIGIDAARRSNADKKLWSEWYSEHGADGEEVINRPAAQWNTEFERQTGKNMVTPEWVQNIIAMSDSVAANKDALTLLNNGEPENSLYWQDKLTGLNLRVRPDYMNHDFISDLKSCADASDYGIRRSMTKYGYHVSQAMYQDGVTHCTGIWKPFLFIFIEKTPPYICRVIALDEHSAMAGWSIYQDNIRKLSLCLEHNDWPSLDNDLNFKLPEWSLADQ